MTYLSGAAEIECNNCRHVFLIDASDMNVDQVGADERQMGLEIYYAGALELNCPKCLNKIMIKYDASEYPVGVPNYYETHTDGAKIINGFKDIDIYFEEEIYSFEEESLLYLPEEKKIVTDLCSGVSALILAVNNNPSILYEIDPRHFEQMIAHIFSLHGFSVELTKQTRDGGRDIIAVRSDLGIKSKFIIECKRYAPNNPVTVELVRALYGVQMQEGANKAVLATTSRFTPDAHTFAKAKNTTEWSMALKDFNDIYQWIQVAATANKSFN